MQGVGTILAVLNIPKAEALQIEEGTLPNSTIQAKVKKWRPTFSEDSTGVYLDGEKLAALDQFSCSVTFEQSEIWDMDDGPAIVRPGLKKGSCQLDGLDLDSQHILHTCMYSGRPAQFLMQMPNHGLKVDCYVRRFSINTGRGVDAELVFTGPPMVQHW